MTLSKIERIPDFGPLNIMDEKEYLENLRAQFQRTWMKPITHKEKLSDFNQLALLGRGKFGIVILVQEKVTDKFYAMKVIEKKKIIKYKMLQNIKNEIHILQCLNFPFTVYLVYLFLGNSYVYIGMPFMSGGELDFYLKKRKLFQEKDAKFFVGQAVLALEYLHSLDLIYRDLKPENIVLDHTGYAKLTDFGFCKLLKDPKRTYTFCGTPYYLAPEVILSKGYGVAVDWWSIGVLMYELVVGMSPFDARRIMDVYEKIVANKYKIPKFVSPELKDLVENILQTDVSRRFGNLKNGVNDIKNHRWFRDFEWLALLNRKLDPPFVPKYEYPGDCRNFENVTPSKLPLLETDIDKEYPAEFKVLDDQFKNT